MPDSAERPGVSFCIPNWNHRDYLARSIRSARRATERLRNLDIPGEIIVIDDASRDGSQRLLLAMAMVEPDLDVLTLSRNVGLAAARNLALRSARYPFVCFLDADNELLPDTFDVFVRTMIATKATVVYGNLIRHDGRRAVGLLSNDHVCDSLYDANYIDALALCDRAALLACGGFDETLDSHEDWEMWLHLIAEGAAFVFVPVCMSYYYVNPHSMVQTTPNVEHARFKRIFNQRRTGLPVGFPARRMYHPDVGWLR